MRGSREKLLRAAIVITTAGVFVVGTYFIASPGAGVNVATSQRTPESDADSIKRVIQEAENLRSAMDAPPPPPESGRRYRDDPQMPLFASVDNSGRHSHLSREQIETMRSRARADLQRLSTPERAEQELKILERVIAAFAEGGEEVIGSGGATVESIESLHIDGDVATAATRETSWGAVGQIDAQTGEVRWAHPTNCVEATFTLKRLEGRWVISERHSRFCGGGGP